MNDYEESARIVSDGVGVRRPGRARVLAWAGSGGLLASLALGVASLAGSVGSVGSLALFLGVLGAVALACAGALTAWVVRRPGSLTVSERKLTVTRGETREEVPTEAIVSGWTVPREGEGADLELELSDGRVITARAPHAVVCHDLLDAAGVGASQRALRVLLGGYGSALLLGLVAPVMLVFTMAGWVIAALAHGSGSGALAACGSLYALCAAVCMALLAPPLVIVGNDGVTVRHRGTSRFYPYDQVSEVTPHGSNLILDLVDGRRVMVQATSGDPSRPAAIASRVQEARDERARTPSAEQLALLDRNERPVSEWLDALKRLLRREQSYREASLTRAEVERVLADPTAPAARRVAAALALVATGEPRATTRVRAAAEACADERVRVALEKAMEGELDEPGLEAAARARQG